MDGLLESVPNFSEGRDRETLDALVEAFGAGGARVLDVHSDADHNRSVFTVVADPDSLVEGLAAAIALSTARIDLTRHQGVHPRVGAADVVPFVRFSPDDPRPEQAARALARRIAMLGVPAIGYGELGDGLRPAAFRAGGPERLAERMEAGEVTALAGPDRPHPTAGAVLLGVRPPLVAFNVDLDTDDVEVARTIAAGIRERDGGLPGVQALGLSVRGGAQVSTNLIDLDATPLHRVTAEIVRLAGERGVGVRRGELVGLMPARVMAAAAGEALLLPGMEADRALEVAAHGEFGES
jgi:glutamate formiminotransferase